VVETGYFASAQNKLYYSCAISSKEVKRRGIVFVHAADGNRFGPHRMFVELARKFTDLGYPTMRFDLTGCGDSGGDCVNDNILGEVTDVVNAVRFFTGKLNLDGVVLFGISRGARVCYQAMAEYDFELDGLVLLSTPISSSRVAMKSLGDELKQYMHKLRDFDSLKKLIKGKADLRQILRTLVKAVKIRTRYAVVKDETFACRVPVLLIYGEHDPIRNQASSYYAEKLGNNQIASQCHIVGNANHSFFHYTWKEEIFAVARQWLESKESDE